MVKQSAVSIEVVYNDGSKQVATGNDAKQIWDWLLACEVSAIVSGARYHGPILKTIQAPEGESVKGETRAD